MYCGLCDFRVNQSAWRETFEIYKEMQGLLASEKELQAMNTQFIADGTSGKMITEILTSSKSYYEKGDYKAAYDNITDMYKLMHCTMSDINTLLKVNENFLANINSDTLVDTPEISSDYEGIINGGILSLNYAEIEDINEICPQICQDTKNISDQMKTTMDSCGDLISNVGTYQDMVDSACKKVQRLENFRTSFQKYAIAIKSLESELTTGFAKIAKQTTATPYYTTGMFAVQHPWSMIKDVDTKYNLKGLTEDEIKGLAERFAESNDTVAMVQVAKQIFAKDVSKWSDAESYFIANTLNHGFEKSEVELIEYYFGQMMTEEYKNHHYEWHTQNGLWTADYVVKPNTAMIDKIMEYLNANDEGELYYTLNRLSKIEVDGGKISKGSAMISEMDGGVFEIEVCKSENGKLQINFKAGELGIFTNELVPEEIVTLTTYDMNELSDTYLKKLGYSSEYIEYMKTNAITDADIGMLENIFAGHYKEAFDTPIDQLSEYMKMGLSAYSIKLCELFNDGNVEELTKFTNGILYTDKDRCVYAGNEYRPEDYFEILTVHTGFLRDLYTAQILSGDLYGEDVKNFSENINEMYSYWYALYAVMYDGDIKIDPILWYSQGDCVVCLEDLKREGDSISFDLNLYPTDYSEILNTQSVSSKVAWTPSESNGDYSLTTIKNIEKQMDNLWMTVPLDIALDALAIYCPEVGGVMKLICNQFSGLDMGSLLSDAGEIDAVKDAIGPNGETALWNIVSMGIYNDNLQQDPKLKNAVMFLIFGVEAVEKEGYSEEYKYDSVLDIDPETFIKAIEVIDNDIKEYSDFDMASLNELWNNVF